MGKAYEFTVLVKVVSPDGDDGGTPENGAAEMGEVVASIEAAIADVMDVDVDAEDHPEGVEVWTVDNAMVTHVDGKDHRTWDK